MWNFWQVNEKSVSKFSIPTKQGYNQHLVHPFSFLGGGVGLGLGGGLGFTATAFFGFGGSGGGYCLYLVPTFGPRFRFGSPSFMRR